MRVERTQSIAIVGAGASGLYLAYRLKHAGFRRLSVFEASARVGGRMHDCTIGPLHTEAALGAQSFSDAHILVSGLCSQLRLDSKKLDFQRGGFALRGLRSVGGALEGVRSRYALQGFGADAYSIVFDLIGVVAPDFKCYWRDERALLHYLDGCVVEGRPLAAWGFWALAAARLCPEACAFVRDCLGLRSCVANTQASSAIFSLLCELRPGQNHFALEGGFSALGARLYAETRADVLYHMESALERITPNADGVMLTVQKGCGARNLVQANAVILTCPPAALQKLRYDDPRLSSVVAECSAEVAEIEASKLCLVFERPWFGRARADVIQSFAADAPLALVLSQQRKAGAQLVTIFTDGENAGFWRSLAKASDAPASTEAIEAALRELQCAFGPAPSAPIASYWIDWSRAGQGAAWHAWTAGADTASVRARLSQPSSDIPLFICGEAFAALQGWVEGAFCSAEMVLERHFGMTRPPWLGRSHAFEI